MSSGDNPAGTVKHWAREFPKVRPLSPSLELSYSNLLEFGIFEWDDEPSRRSDPRRLLDDAGPPFDESPSLVPQSLIRPTFRKEEC